MHAVRQPNAISPLELTQNELQTTNAWVYAEVFELVYVLHANVHQLRSAYFALMNHHCQGVRSSDGGNREQPITT